jgi:spore germination protein
MQRSWLRSAAYLVTVVFFGFALLGVVGRAAAPPGAVRASVAGAAPDYLYPLYLLLPRPRVTGFYENTASTPGGMGSFASFASHARDLNVVSPLWYSIGPTGAIANDRSQARLIALARREHVAVMPLVTNLGSNMLTSPGPRAAAVRSLVRIASHSGYRGVVLDFELLPPSARPGLTALVNELSLRLHASGRRLGIAVFPKLGVVGTLPVAYDYPRLGKDADEVVLMAYDAHYDGGAPGPVAPFPWVQSNLLYALRFIPRGHVYLGLGFYGYDWSSASGGSATTVSMPEAYAIARRQGVPVAWDAPSGEGHYRYGSHIVWFETPHSLAEKASMARRYGIGGIAVWRLGFENGATWQTVMRALKTGRAPAVPPAAQAVAGGGRRVFARDGDA